MIAKFLSSSLQKLLHKLGRCIGHNPWPFLLLPLVLSCGLALAVGQAKRISTAQNALELYIPNSGLGRRGRTAIMRALGDVWQSELDPINGVTFAIIVRRRGGGDVLDARFVREYARLRETMLRLRVRGAGYEHMCYQNRLLPGACLPDLLLTVASPSVRTLHRLQYPTTKIGEEEVQLPLGGVNTTSLNYVTHARAVLMTFTFSYQFFLPAQTWQRLLIHELDVFSSDTIMTSVFTLSQFQADLGSIAESLQTMVPLLLLVVLVFCVIACCVVDWVHSKPLLAVAGVLSALCAIITGFGVCILLGVPTVDIVYVAPFLMLSVGVDDMFLLLASWRKTRQSLDVPSRMAESFGDAAVSITITSLTDVLSFAIGASTVFPAVRHFCTYTAVSMLFTYLYQITMFGAAMALSGRREAQRRHSFFVCIKLRSSDEAADESLLYKLCCTGGDDVAGEGGTSSSQRHSSKTTLCMPISPQDNIFNIFFTRYYAPLLQLRGVKLMAAMSYVLYLGMAVYGTGNVSIGMNYAQLLPDGSPTAKYLNEYDEYFANDISPPLEILLPPTDMSLEGEQRRALDIVQQFEHGPYTTTADFWLLDFLPNVGRDDDFYEALHSYSRTSRYAPHLRLDPLARRVTSRVLIQTRRLAFGQERLFVEYVKEVLHSISPSNVTAFHSSMQLGEQQSAVLPAMLATVGGATLVMLLVSFLLIPRAACSLCLAACIISTNLGVLGAMSLWGVRLDIISMITVLMSVGISVDFVAHVSYYYVQAMQMDVPLSQAQRALRHLGLPIMQGALSTTCGMSVLLAVDAYMVRAFVKTLMLVVLFGLYHGLLLLPIVLSLFLNDDNEKRSKAAAIPPSYRPPKGPPPPPPYDNVVITRQP